MATRAMEWSGARGRGRGPSRGLANWLKTGILLAGMTALVLVIGQALGGSSGLLVAAAFALVMNGVSYWYSDRIALAAYRAQPLSREQDPRIHEMVERLVRKAGIPKPRIYLVDAPAPNAFATGRNPGHAAVAVTSGILALLDDRELEGVLAHELSHVRNRDTLVSTVAATLAGMVVGLASIVRWGALLGTGRDDREGGGLYLLAMAIVAPLAAMLLQFAVSRSREYGADGTGAGLAGSSEGLATALLKLEAGARRFPDDRHPATASLWMVNPLSRRGLNGLFSTHPPTEERVRRLQSSALA